MKSIDYVNSVFEGEKDKKQGFDGQQYTNVSKKLSDLKKREQDILYKIDNMDEAIGRRAQLKNRSILPSYNKQLSSISDSIRIIQAQKDSLSNEYDKWRKKNPR